MHRAQQHREPAWAGTSSACHCQQLSLVEALRELLKLRLPLDGLVLQPRLDAPIVTGEVLGERSQNTSLEICDTLLEHAKLVNCSLTDSAPRLVHGDAARRLLDAILHKDFR